MSFDLYSHATLGTLVIHFLNFGSSGWFIRGYPGHASALFELSRPFRRDRHHYGWWCRLFRVSTPRGETRGVDEPNRGNSSLWKFIYWRRKLSKCDCFEFSLKKILFLLFYVKKGRIGNRTSEINICMHIVFIILFKIKIEIGYWIIYVYSSFLIG